MMSIKKHIITVAAATILGTVAIISINSADIKPYFSPKGGCEAAIVDQINQANDFIHIQAYSFTSKAITQALITAANRKVTIFIILDSDDAKTVSKQAADSLKAINGITVMTDGKHAIAHNKIILIDNKIVITGSYNFTNQAEHSNAENILIINSPSLNKLYLNNWLVHSEHSVNY